MHCTCPWPTVAANQYASTAEDGGAGVCCVHLQDDGIASRRLQKREQVDWPFGRLLSVVDLTFHSLPSPLLPPVAAAAAAAATATSTPPVRSALATCRRPLFPFDPPFCPPSVLPPASRTSMRARQNEMGHAVGGDKGRKHPTYAHSSPHTPAAARTRSVIALTVPSFERTPRTDTRWH